MSSNIFQSDRDVLNHVNIGDFTVGNNDVVGAQVPLFPYSKRLSCTSGVCTLCIYSFLICLLTSVICSEKLGDVEFQRRRATRGVGQQSNWTGASLHRLPEWGNTGIWAILSCVHIALTGVMTSSYDLISSHLNSVQFISNEKSLDMQRTTANGISIDSAVFTKYTVVTDGQTDGQTEGLRDSLTGLKLLL